MTNDNFSCLFSFRNVSTFDRYVTQVLLFKLIYEGKKGYINVGDGCWKRTVLMTTFRYWWRFCPFWSTIFLHWTPKCERCHFHQNSFTNTHKSSPTSRCYQHYCRPSYLSEIALEKSFWVYWRNWLLKSVNWKNLKKNPNQKKNSISKLILQREHQARILSHLKFFSNKSLLK